ncbi:hypothetical protein [Kocuria rosea]|uniref:hypothetical protein n=1 Tax=Kocuria rosea TaxID=1275 RepID=UPI0012FC51D9|nr:hypothetical protein [Kocuria polaris]
MTNTHHFRLAAVGLGIALALSACGSTSHGISVLDAESSTQPVPDTVESSDLFLENSTRFLGEIDGYTYFTAKPASAPDQEACLIQLDPAGEDWVSGCSAIRSDKVVVLVGGTPSQEVALVSDDPSEDFLEGSGWEKRADNLWQRTS